MGEFVVAIDDPESADVRAILDTHLAFAKQHSPPEDVHVLDFGGLLAENVSCAGFETCEPFGEYGSSPNSVCMTLELDQRGRPDAASTQTAFP